MLSPRLVLKIRFLPLKDDNDSVACTERNMGNLLNTFFASVFTNETTDSLLSIKQIFRGTDNEMLMAVQNADNGVVWGS